MPALRKPSQDVVPPVPNGLSGADHGKCAKGAKLVAASIKTPPPSCNVLVVCIGIDPGNSGGLACLRSDGRKWLQALADLTPHEIWAWLRGRIDQAASDARDAGLVCRIDAAIEKVGGYVGDGEGEKGGGAANGSSMFKFGRSFGELRMALVAAGIPFDEVPPRTWQRTAGISPRVKANRKKGVAGEAKHEFKKRLRQAAQHMYPETDHQIRITSDTADAVLIAHHLMSQRG